MFADGNSCDPHRQQFGMLGPTLFPLPLFWQSTSCSSGARACEPRARARITNKHGAVCVCPLHLAGRIPPIFLDRLASLGLGIARAYAHTKARGRGGRSCLRSCPLAPIPAFLPPCLPPCLPACLIPLRVHVEYASAGVGAWLSTNGTGLSTTTARGSVYPGVQWWHPRAGAGSVALRCESLIPMLRSGMGETEYLPQTYTLGLDIYFG